MSPTPTPRFLALVPGLGFGGATGSTVDEAVETFLDAYADEAIDLLGDHHADSGTLTVLVFSLSPTLELGPAVATLEVAWQRRDRPSAPEST